MESNKVKQKIWSLKSMIKIAEYLLQRQSGVNMQDVESEGKG